MLSGFHRIADVESIYRLLEPLPIVAGDRSLIFYLVDRPPLAIVEFKARGRTYQVGIYQGVEHARHVVANGLKVVSRAPVAAFLDQLVAEGRAVLVAGPHCPVIWLVDPKAPRVELDAYFTWRGHSDDSGAPRKRR